MPHYPEREEKQRVRTVTNIWTVMRVTLIFIVAGGMGWSLACSRFSAQFERLTMERNALESEVRSHYKVAGTLIEETYRLQHKLTKANEKVRVLEAEHKQLLIDAEDTSDRLREIKDQSQFLGAKYLCSIPKGFGVRIYLDEGKLRSIPAKPCVEKVDANSEEEYGDDQDYDPSSYRNRQLLAEHLRRAYPHAKLGGTLMTWCPPPTSCPAPLP